MGTDCHAENIAALARIELVFGRHGNDVDLEERFDLPAEP